LPFNSEDENSTMEGEPGNLSDPSTSFSLQSILASGAIGKSQCETKETILLVEDEAFVRKATAEALESAGYQVIVACNAREGMELHRQCFDFVDLLLADVVMPGLSGRELAAQILAIHPLIRILLMSGYSEQTAMCDTSPARQEYLAKPFSTLTLLRRVREVLERPLLRVGVSA
jgi:two-component system cell cycle sensor histidine kinase/response regulator CckA